MGGIRPIYRLGPIYEGQTHMGVCVKPLGGHRPLWGGSDPHREGQTLRGAQTYMGEGVKPYRGLL